MAEDERYLRELGNKVYEMDGKLDQLIDVLPIVTNHGERVAKVENSTAYAHKRITETNEMLEKEIKEVNEASIGRANKLDEKVERTEKRIYMIAGTIVTAIQFLFFVLNQVR